ncbi:MAG: hypothetical protein KDA84_09340 [Planctomycetaceae bacterium]|nr:hypothetical protein [Planctomycetaceae bacterium]
MHVQRQSSNAILGGRFPAGLVAGVICLFATTTAFGQLFPNGFSSGGQPGGDPAMNSLYGPPPGPWGGGFPPQDMMLPSADGMQQTGEMNTLNYSQSLGDYGNVSLYGSPQGDSPGAGLQYQSVKPTWANFRDVQLGVYVNEEQSVVNAGTTLELFANDRFGSAARVLMGRSDTDHYRDSFHFTGDVYAGSTILFHGEHWIKAGAFLDSQDNFHKYGPELGVLLFADRKHPFSIDAAYGMGHGDLIVNPINSTVTTIADHDYQARFGTYLTPNLQVGFSGNWLTWNDGRFTDYDGYGGFFSLNYGTMAITADYTYGDGQSRGFINVAYTFGGRRARLRDETGQYAAVEHPRDWLTRPIIRDTSLQIQRATFVPAPTPVVNQGAGVGNLTQVNCAVRLRQGTFQTENGSGTIVLDLNSNGIIDPGDTPEVLVQLVNNSSQVAQNVSFAFASIATPGQFARVAGVQGSTVGNVAPSSTGMTMGFAEDIDVVIDPSAPVGTQVFVEFEVTADGQTRRFRCGPLVVGQPPNGNFTQAVPIN